MLCPRKACLKPLLGQFSCLLVSAIDMPSSVDLLHHLDLFHLLACCAGQPMAAVQAEDRLAAAEAGTAGSSAAKQKASIKGALNTPTDPEDIIISVSCLVTAHYA